MNNGPILKSIIFVGYLVLPSCTQSSEEWRYLGALTPSQVEDGSARWEGNELVLMGNLDIRDNAVWVVDRETAEQTNVVGVPTEFVDCLRQYDDQYVGIGADYISGEIVFIGEVWLNGGEVPMRICDI